MRMPAETSSQDRYSSPAGSAVATNTTSSSSPRSTLGGSNKITVTSAVPVPGHLIKTPGLFHSPNATRKNPSPLQQRHRHLRRRHDQSIRKPALTTLRLMIVVVALASTGTTLFHSWRMSRQTSSSSSSHHSDATAEKLLVHPLEQLRRQRISRPPSQLLSSKTNTDAKGKPDSASKSTATNSSGTNSSGTTEDTLKNQAPSTKRSNTTTTTTNIASLNALTSKAIARKHNKPPGLRKKFFQKPKAGSSTRRQPPLPIKQPNKIENSTELDKQPNWNSTLKNSASEPISAIQATDQTKTEENQNSNKQLPANIDFTTNSNLPPPPVLENNESFAACLLIKDDNHWLIEWLAYHYFVMPLRTVIVVIDPNSQTSPRHIFRRWTQRKLMNIYIWEDHQFLPANLTFQDNDRELLDNNTELIQHRVRQTVFYQTCIGTLRNYGMPWLMLVDTDEFVLPTYASAHFQPLTSQVSFQEPGSVLRLLKYQEQLAKMKSSGTSNDNSHTNNQSCVYMPRFFFGGKESPPEFVTHQIPDSINATGMLTQRYLFREPKRNLHGKNLLYLPHLPAVSTFGNVHDVSVEACPDPSQMLQLDHTKHSLIRVHHYLGSWEQYSFRDDPRLAIHDDPAVTAHQVELQRQNKTVLTGYHRRGYDRYMALNRAATQEDHAARAWIRGFVKHMGEDLASELLRGVGRIGFE